MTQLTFGGGRLETQFWKFHREHPEIYALLKRFAREWNRPCGIGLLWERLRWEIGIQTGEQPSLNNNHRAYYARLLMLEPELKGLFKLRQQRVQATFGPDNKGLPDNRHIA